MLLLCIYRLAGQFVQVFIPALLVSLYYYHTIITNSIIILLLSLLCHSLQPMVIEVMMQKYLQAQSLVWVFVVVGILQNIINVLVAALFIYVGDIVIM